MANKNSKEYYYDLTPTAEDIDNILTDLAEVLKDVGENDVVKRVKAINGERAKFVLGEGGSGAHVDANLREIIVGDGEGNARGGSRDSEQRNETLYIEHLDVCDQNELPLLTHYIYSPNTSNNTRFIFGEKYIDASASKKMPEGNFMMVEGNSFIKAKGESRITLSGNSELRISGGSQATVANGSQVNIENGAKVHIFGASNNTEVDITKEAKVYIHGGGGGQHNALLQIDVVEGSNTPTQNTILAAHSGGQAFFENNCFFMITDQAKFYAENNSMFHMTDNANIQLENNCFFRVSNDATFIAQGKGMFVLNNDYRDYRGSHGPLFTIDADSGRVFTNEGSLTSDYGVNSDFTFYTLLGHNYNLRYLTHKAMNEVNANPSVLSVSDRTYNTLKKCWAQIDKGVFTYPYYSNLVKTYKKLNQEEGASLLEAWNYLPSSNRYKTLCTINPVAVAKKEKYYELTQRVDWVTINVYSEAQNKYYVPYDKYVALKTALGNDFDIYFDTYYEISGYYWSEIVAYWNSHHTDVADKKGTPQERDYVTFRFIEDNDYMITTKTLIYNATTTQTDVSSYFTYVDDEPTRFYELRSQSQTNFENAINNATKNLDFYIDPTTHKFNLSYYGAYQDIIKYINVKMTENYKNNITVNCSGSNDGMEYIQIASNANKRIDITILDGAQVELNGDARITLTSKDLPYQYPDGVTGLVPPPIRYKAGLTLNFTEDAYDHWTNTEEIDGVEYCISDDTDEIHFSIEELQVLKQLVQNHLNPQL